MEQLFYRPDGNYYDNTFEFYELSLKINHFLMRKRKILLIAALLLLLILLSIVSLPIISDHLSKTDRVKANILLVEGWLPSYAIEMAYNESKEPGYDHVITTGINISGYFQISMNGFLIFHTRERLKEINNPGEHTIAIEAYSDMEEENCAHFNVFVNDSMIADFFADKKKSQYLIQWKGNLTEIDSVMIQFDNDKFDKDVDRNLYVREIIFDRMIHISYQHNSEYDIGELDRKRRLNNNYNSHAELARNALLSLGIDSSLVLAIPGKRVRINRTLSSALAFRDWLKTSDIDVQGINIVTEGTHARRTWMTYNKILDKKYEIGIISLPEYEEHPSWKYKVFNTLREAIGLVYYWFILIPY